MSLMDRPNPEQNGSQRPAPRRPWVAPVIAKHESLTVLTQHFFGPAGVLFALQINCGVSGNKFGC
jgi:hypothetical protein